MNYASNGNRGLRAKEKDLKKENCEFYMDDFDDLSDADDEELGIFDEEDMRSSYTTSECKSSHKEKEEANTCKRCFSAGLEEGYEAGVADGQNAACRKAYKRGYNQGYKKGYREGYKKGYEKGYREGYEKGYEKAKEEVLVHIRRRNRCCRRRNRCCRRRCSCCCCCRRRCCHC